MSAAVQMSKVCRFFVQTLHKLLTFLRGSGLYLTAYINADYADKSNNRRSVSGTVFSWGVLPSVSQVTRRGASRCLQQKKGMYPWIKG